MTADVRATGEAPGGVIGGFGGAAVVTFESRRAVEMASLIGRHGGVPISAPAMREVALADNGAALAFVHTLRDGAVDVVVLMTGVGTRALVREVAGEMDAAAFAALLSRARVVVRGPKPASALRELGMRDFITVPEPNTWREVAVEVARVGSASTSGSTTSPAGALPLAGCRVAVQEHGAPSRELYAALAELGATVTPIRVYTWALPDDVEPLRSGIRALAEGRARIALFTSRAQVDHAFAVAAEEGLDGALRESLRNGVVASIGPVCSEALRGEGLTPDLEPEHSKMGHLVKAAAARAAAILEAKRMM